MKVLVACEESGAVRDAFLCHGHEAVSCDLIESSSDFGRHLKCDVKSLSLSEYDMVIAFPPCTYLCCSGNAHRSKRKKQEREAAAFFMWFAEAPVKFKAIENPIGVMSSVYRKPDQIIQPWQFGHEESKATCLWLFGLPKLVPTMICENRRNNLTPSGQNRLPPSPDRAKLRSKTYSGVAEAMAYQWGDYAAILS